jgi:hypothetical protein
VTDRKLDRIESPSSRSAEYPIRTLLDSLTVRSWTWRHIQLDQGAEGDCVAFDVTMEAAARPKPFFGDPVYDAPLTHVLNGYAHSVVMSRCRFHDQHQYSEGATQLAGMKTGVDLGYWKGYRWATGTPEQKARDVLCAIRLGPVCFASDWHTGMSWPRTPGELVPEGNAIGGHSYLLTKVSAKKGAAWTPNSWGGEGQGWLTEASLISLFRAGAEAGLPVDRRPRPAS